MSNRTAFIGIDPGKSGAIGIITEDFIVSYPYNEKEYIKSLACMLSTERPFAIVENVHSMPKQGVASSFNFGKNFGWILGVLDTLFIPYELVSPQKWKREFGCTQDKNTSIECARRLFPNVSLRTSTRCTKDNDGMAEALLMAEYARRHINNNKQ